MNSTELNSKAGGPTRIPSPGAETADVFRRAKTGDKTALAQLHALALDPRRGPEFVEQYGSPASWLLHGIINSIAEKTPPAGVAMREKFANLRRELEGPNPTPLESLLAERVALCWLQVNRYELWAFGDGSRTLGELGPFQGLIDRAHGRFLKAVKTLAQVRRLAVPMLQVNIGRNQVNVSGMVSGEALGPDGG